MDKFERLIETDYGSLKARGFHMKDDRKESYMMYFIDVPGAVVEGKTLEETTWNLKAALEAILDITLDEFLNTINDDNSDN